MCLMESARRGKKVNPGSSEVLNWTCYIYRLQAASVLWSGIQCTPSLFSVLMKKSVSGKWNCWKVQHPEISGETRQLGFYFIPGILFKSLHFCFEWDQYHISYWAGNCVMLLEEFKWIILEYLLDAKLWARQYEPDTNELGLAMFKAQAGLELAIEPPASTSWVAEITGMRHSWIFFFN
jgi:hypothetical protein